MHLGGIALWTTLAVNLFTLARSQNNDEVPSLGNPSAEPPVEKPIPVTPNRDPFWCQKQLGDVKLFEVFPGLGWDNLRNLETSQVVLYTFDQCKLTDGGRYLIPDNVFTVPVKTSRLESFAELIDQWHNTSSLTARSININAGLTYSGVSISGSFSHDTQEMKSKQIQEKAVTVRVKLQHNSYEAKLQPHFPLTSEFKTSVKRLAMHIVLDQIEMARYAAQLIVRDFGTHVLTSVTAGAALVKDDFIKRDYVASQTNDKTEILATASASFFGIFKIDSSVSHKTEKSVSDAYTASMTHSIIKGIGGPIIRSQDLTVDQWSDQVDTNLVAMDRTGDPLYFVITPENFPELPAATVFQTARFVQSAIKVYYDMNIIRGCTRLGSPQFSAFANFDDGTCTAPTTNSTFGGVYQTCSVSGQYLNTNPCSGMSEVNPKTGKYSCPPSYTEVKILQGSKLGVVETSRRCRRCGFLRLRRCCRTDRYQATANYITFWCAGVGAVEPQSGYRFGGVFTSTSINLVTGTKRCPKGFYVQKLLADMSVCVSDDFELSTPFFVPFAGFFSCQTGNPLASLGGQSWPSRCPDGFSQHLATVVQGCAFHYCVQSGALVGPNLPPAKRPPFMQKPALPMMDANDSFVMLDPQTQTWMKNQEAMELLMETEPQAQTQTEKPNGGTRLCSTVAIVIAMVFSALWSV